MVLRRKVWTKTSGDHQGRKLLVWATYKEHRYPHYPAYVIHWTDYSPTRKRPSTETSDSPPTKPPPSGSLSNSSTTTSIAAGPCTRSP